MARSILEAIQSKAGSAPLQERIAQALGISPSAVRTAVAAAIPAILSALISLISRRGGADSLASALRGQDQNALGNLTNVLGGSNQQSAIDSGRSQLSALLGDSSVGGLANAISGFSGVNRGAAGSLLGIVGPLVIGALGREQRNAGGNASDLASVLMSQKESVAAALPSGLTSLLAGTGVLDGVADRLGAGAAAATRAGQAAAAQAAGVASEAARRAAPRSSWLRNLGILAVILIMAAIAYALLALGPSAPDLTVNGVDLGKEVTSGIDTAKQALQGVTDAASAGAAVPKLQDVSAKLDGLIGSAGQLSGGAKTALGAIVSAALPALKEAIDKILAIPGVADQLKPTTDEIMAKLTKLAT